LTSEVVALSDIDAARRNLPSETSSHGRTRHEELEKRRSDLEFRRESVQTQTAALWRAFDDDAADVAAQVRDAVDVRDRYAQEVEQRRRRRAGSDEATEPLQPVEVGTS